MSKQKAIKEMNDALNEMARFSEGSELYKAAKAKHTKAKAFLIAIVDAESSPVESAESELSEIVANVESRNNRLVKKAGVNANSVLAGLASGSLSTQTDEETQRIYELKQILMANSGNSQAEARARILARRAERKLKVAA